MTRALGIDVGTSGVRAAIVDATKSVVAYAAEPFAPAGCARSVGLGRRRRGGDGAA